MKSTGIDGVLIHSSEAESF